MKTKTASLRSQLFAGIAAAGIALASFSSSAEDIRISLNGDREVPPVKTMASGSGTITINPDMSVSGSIMTSGLAATMAHIHLGAADKNGPVVVTLSKSGEHGWVVPPGTKLTAAQYQAYKAGELYVNVHTAEHKGGEIRGQLTP
ncbi:MAG: CHRD domain-containing protein [Rhodocyclales bacterium]|nr:CHRD domain-containing protein [Rhodocyclales bacterium]